ESVQPFSEDCREEDHSEDNFPQDGALMRQAERVARQRRRILSCCRFIEDVNGSEFTTPRATNEQLTEIKSATTTMTLPARRVIRIPSEPDEERTRIGDRVKELT